jgi:hypothetical protein
MSDFPIDFEWSRGEYEYETPDGYQGSPAPRNHFPQGWDYDGYIRGWVDGLLQGFLVRRGNPQKVPPTGKQLESAVTWLVKCASKKNDADPLTRFAELKKAALHIARTVGVFLPEEPQESLMIWDDAARKLRAMFEGKPEEWPMPRLSADPWRNKRRPPARSDLSKRVGVVGVHLIPDKNGTKLAIRPDDLMQALVLYAARMIAAGTGLNTCLNCNLPFLEGGGRDRRNRKRAGSRFCSEKCRYGYHNELRRKTARKAKL